MSPPCRSLRRTSKSLHHGRAIQSRIANLVALYLLGVVGGCSNNAHMQSGSTVQAEVETGRTHVTSTVIPPPRVVRVSAACLGDANADGFSDTALAIMSIREGNMQSRVILLSGKDGHIIYSKEWSVDSEFLGYSMLRCADCNDDGVADILLCGPHLPVAERRGPFGPGRVLLLSGRDGALIHEFVGDPGEHRFGCCALQVYPSGASRGSFVISRARGGDTLATLYSSEDFHEEYSIDSQHATSTTARLSFAYLPRPERPSQSHQDDTLVVGVVQQVPDAPGESYVTCIPLRPRATEVWSYPQDAKRRHVCSIGSEILSLNAKGKSDVAEIVVVCAGVPGMAAAPGYAVILDGETGDAQKVWGSESDPSDRGMHVCELSVPERVGERRLVISEYGESGTPDRIVLCRYPELQIIANKEHVATLARHWYGCAIAPTGDLDGDGLCDVLVCSVSEGSGGIMCEFLSGRDLHEVRSIEVSCNK